MAASTQTVGPSSRPWTTRTGRSTSARVTSRVIGSASDCRRPGRTRTGPISKDGRKHLAGSALLDGEGEVLAVAEALLIEARPG